MKRRLWKFAGINMKPSIGRIVHYTGIENDDQTPSCLAAIITRVINETTVNLTVFTPFTTYTVSKVYQGDGIGSWHWPERVE